MGSSTNTKEQVNSSLEMDIQKKNSIDGSIEKHKEIFVALKFSQKEGINFEETFAPVARYTSIRIILALTSKMKWKLHQMDVKTTFLNGVIEEEVYIE